MRARGPLVVGVASCAFLLVACGSRQVAGTYNCPHQSVLVLRKDGTFSTVGHDAAFQGSYEVDDDTIAFTVEGLEPTRAVIEDDGSIVFVEHDHGAQASRAPRPERCVRR